MTAFEERVTSYCKADPFIDKSFESEGEKIVIKAYQSTDEQCIYWDIIGPSQFSRRAIVSQHGEINTDNPLIRTLFEWLIMDDEDLEKFVGNDSIMNYRAGILGAIWGLRV